MGTSRIRRNTQKPPSRGEPQGCEWGQPDQREPEGMKGERDGQPGLIATAARGKTASAHPTRRGQEPQQMRGERHGNRDPAPPQPAGELPLRP
jgi:hypothetical protein